MGTPNGGQLPGWVKLVAVGFTLAGGWFTLQATVRELQDTQREVKAEVKALRDEMRSGLVTRAEFQTLQLAVENNRQRIEAVDAHVWAAGTGRKRAHWDWQQ